MRHRFPFFGLGTMKKSLRLAALVGIVGLTSWLSSPVPVHAMVECIDIDDQFCDPNWERRITCWSTSAQRTGYCDCDFVWWCKIP
jgi:hypothetical protein